MVDERAFPFAPKSAGELRVGDLIAVPIPDGTWGCLLVINLRLSGPGARTSLWVSPLSWHGVTQPTAERVEGAAQGEQAMTRMELFHQGGLEVTGHDSSTRPRRLAGPDDLTVGASHLVWGWRSAIRHGVEAAMAIEVATRH